jgi:thioredoxin reductase
MTKEPEALRLAESLEQLGADIYFTHRTEDLEAAAIELRRLHAVNEELLEALEAAVEHLDWVGYGDKWERECAHSAELPSKLECAIAKATGETE